MDISTLTDTIKSSLASIGHMLPLDKWLMIVGVVLVIVVIAVVCRVRAWKSHRRRERQMRQEKAKRRDFRERQWLNNEVGLERMEDQMDK